MPHSEEWAKRLLSRLPREPEELLGRRSFWDLTFLGLYLDRLDDQIFHDPQKALKWARVAPLLAFKAPEDEGPEGRRAHRETLVRANAILGGAYRAVGRLDDAEEPYRTALQVAESKAISPEVRSDLNLRLAHLRASLGRPSEALRLADQALDGSEGLNRSRVLIWRGYALAELGRYSEAVKSFGDALPAINPKESAAAERAHYAAVHNFAYAIPKANTNDAWTGLEYVRKARKLLKGQRRSVARHKLNWVEGIIWRTVSMDARAEQAFNVARRGFIRLRLPWEIALVSLDLCTLHYDCAERPELESLAADTFQRFKALSGSTQAVAALSLCVRVARSRRTLETARDVTSEAIDQARHSLGNAIDGAREVVVTRMPRP